MLLIILSILLLSGSAIIVFRKTTSDLEKIGFASGVTSLLSLPFGVVGLFYSAFNLQGIFDNKSGWVLFTSIWFFSQLSCVFCLLKHFVRRLLNR